MRRNLRSHLYFMAFWNQCLKTTKTAKFLSLYAREPRCNYLYSKIIFLVLDWKSLLFIFSHTCKIEDWRGHSFLVIIDLSASTCKCKQKRLLCISLGKYLLVTNSLHPKPSRPLVVARDKTIGLFMEKPLCSLLPPKLRWNKNCLGQKWKGQHLISK